VLLLVLCIDAYSVSRTSTIMFAAGVLLPARMNSRPPERTTKFFNRTADGFEEVAGPEHRASSDLEVLVRLRPSTTGLWAPTAMHFDTRLHHNIYRGSPLSDPERQWMRDRFIDDLKRGSKVERASRQSELLGQPERSNATIHLPLGYAHNAGALAALAAFVWSLGWIPRLFDERRRATLRAAGLCPFCRYDLQGLKSAVCPECGKATG